jgi:hypothetical protein
MNRTPPLTVEELAAAARDAERDAIAAHIHEFALAWERLGNQRLADSLRMLALAIAHNAHRRKEGDPIDLKAIEAGLRAVYGRKR